MGCSHSPSCPLFPKLNASLQGWRDAYCDSSTGWQSCARYQQSHTGQPVPLSLLPNGRLASTIARPGTAEGPRSRFLAAPVSVLDTGADSRFEAAGPPAAHLTAEPPPPGPPARPRAAARPTARPPDIPDGVAATRSVAVAARSGPSGPPTPSWWARLVEWMRSPA